MADKVISPMQENPLYVLIKKKVGCVIDEKIDDMEEGIVKNSVKSVKDIIMDDNDKYKSY